MVAAVGARRIMRIASHCVLMDAPCTYKSAVSFVMYAGAAVVRGVYSDERSRKPRGRLCLFSCLPSDPSSPSARRGDPLREFRAEPSSRGARSRSIDTARARLSAVHHRYLVRDVPARDIRSLRARARARGSGSIPRNLGEKASSPRKTGPNFFNPSRARARAPIIRRSCVTTAAALYAFLAPRSCYFTAININSAARRPRLS